MPSFFRFLLASTVFIAWSQVSNAQLDTGQIIHIPVIFHVLYTDTNPDNGVDSASRSNGNTTQDVPTAKILAELKDLHDDFMGLNADQANVLPLYQSRIGHPNIDFFLADTTFGSPGDKGIIRIYTRRNVGDQMWRTSPVIDPEHYLNVYIGHLKGSDGTTNLPEDSGYNSTDGVRLNFKWVGLHYRLLTHETGHWLGLLHIYGGGGGASGNRYSYSVGDGIPDTPPQRNSTDGLCVTCPPPYGTAVDQTCITGTPSNYNNFMDYSGCRFMFTAGQVTKMRNVLVTFRPKIVRSSP